MSDFIFVALIVGLFAASAGLIVFFENLSTSRGRP
jgi:hypothetical protein